MDRFFGIHIQPDTLSGMSAALILSVLLGGLVGLERELNAHPAGLRTHILVCLGSCVMTLVSANMGHGSNDRIAAQVVSGVGFLGAGAIIREGASVRGLTTAASIWATAGLGIALGSGPFLAQIAVIAAALIIFTLWTLDRLEDWMEDTGKRVLVLSVTTPEDPALTGHVVEQVGRSGARVASVRVEGGPTPGTQRVEVKLTLTKQLPREKLLAEVAQVEGVVEVRVQ